MIIEPAICKFTGSKLEDKRSASAKDGDRLAEPRRSPSFFLGRMFIHPQNSLDLCLSTLNQNQLWFSAPDAKFSMFWVLVQWSLVVNKIFVDILCEAPGP